MKTTDLKKIAQDKFDKHINMFKSNIAKALPKHLTSDRMCRIAMTEVRNVPKLLECNQESLFACIMKASQLGLEIGNHLGHAYLLPYGKEVQLIIGYRGMIDLARRSGKIKSINAHAVFENDDFEFELGLVEKLKHVPTRGDRGEFICVYAIAHLTGGGYQLDVMFKSDIEKCILSSKSANSSYSPWKTHYEEMAKKTVIRRIFKFLPISIEFQEAIIKEELVDAGVETPGYTYDHEEAEDTIDNKEGGTQAAIDALIEQTNK